ncbi:serine/threonine protein kinase [Actinoallomurus bryophytorum]|uniref:non-specific serine/threonine protein kinase n=1 Tax=Actinoallomurus bryophytorum TaxID=1490222 RepID=A0A543CN86_9ACTN|nr:serine/threonine protein kinase [Actinoallomurus bryophytorum]
MLGRRYRLLSQVGRGGMGRVWQAHDDLLHRDVAVKEVIFPPGLTDSDREVLYERTLREARSAARLSHPGIVTVHDVVEEDGRPWIVMEYVRARSLQEILDSDGRLPAARVADIGVQMLAALRVAHAAGVLHRDVKPANVLLDMRGREGGDARVVITDFGIARMDGDATLTQTGVVLGSPAFIAPERARGELASPASDLWALGATLYAACEGRSPHDRVEAMAALTAVLHEEPAPPRNAGPIASVLMGLLVKDPAQRMTADEANRDLARAARGELTETNGIAETWRDIPDTPRAAGPWTAEFGGRGPATDETVQELNGSVPGPDPAPARQDATTSRRPRVILLIVLVFLLVVAACAVVLLTRHSADGASGSTSPTPTPTTPLTPRSTPSARVPAGYQRSPGPGGASLLVPTGWTRQVRKNSVLWTQPSTGAQIQLDTTPWDYADPVAHWREFERQVRARNLPPGFREVRLSDRFTAPGGWPASDLAFTYLTKDHGIMTATDRGLTANGRQYAIFVAYPGGKNRYPPDLADRVIGSFQPPA